MWADCKGFWSGGPGLGNRKRKAGIMSDRAAHQVMEISIWDWVIFSSR